MSPAGGKGVSVKTLGETVVKDIYGKADEVDGGQDHGGNAANQDSVFGDDTSCLIPQKATPGFLENHSPPLVKDFFSLSASYLINFKIVRVRKPLFIFPGADTLQQGGRGVSRHEGQNLHPPPPGQDHFPTGDLFQSVVPPFDQDIRLQSSD